jgi:hypothetical protein
VAKRRSGQRASRDCTESATLKTTRFGKVTSAKRQMRPSLLVVRPLYWLPYHRPRTRSDQLFTSTNENTHHYRLTPTNNTPIFAHATASLSARPSAVHQRNGLLMSRADAMILILTRWCCARRTVDANISSRSLCSEKGEMLFAEAALHVAQSITHRQPRKEPLFDLF